MQSLEFLKSKTVLLAEDDTITRTYISKTLTLFFKEVLVAENGEVALKLYRENNPDVLIIDIKMPKCDGLTLIRKIRSENYKLPILLVSSFTERNMLLDAANLSVDGYLVKPIDIQELVLVLKKAFNRVESCALSYKLNDELTLDMEKAAIIKNGEEFSLGIKEMELLRLLLQNPEKTCSKEMIIHALWPDEFISDSTLKMTVNRLRQKLGDDLIISVRGIGYRINLKKV